MSDNNKPTASELEEQLRLKTLLGVPNDIDAPGWLSVEKARQLHEKGVIKHE